MFETNSPRSRDVLSDWSQPPSQLQWWKLLRVSDKLRSLGTWGIGHRGPVRADKEPRMAAAATSAVRSFSPTLTLWFLAAAVVAFGPAGCRKDGDMDASLPRPNFDG